MNITLEVTGISDLLKQIQQRKKVLSGQDPVMYEGIRQVVRDSTFENFIVHGRPTRWKKRKRPYPWPILIKTGNLLEETLRHIEQDPWEHQPPEHQLKILSPYYGWFHQYGAPNNNLVPRPYIYLTKNKERPKIKKIITESLNGKSR